MDKELLFKPRIGEDTVEIPGIGTVRVRGLSRLEAIEAKRAQDGAEFERKILALGLVDPVLTEDEIELWQKASPAGEMEAVTERISQLSGLAEEAPKSGVPADGDGLGPGVRPLPGAEVVDDGGPDAPRDA